MAKRPPTEAVEGDAQSVALRRLAEATAERERAERAWRKAVHDAVAAGASLRQTGAVAGVSYGRIGQISREG